VIRIVQARSEEGASALRDLALARQTPDFGSLRDALPIVERVLSDRRPPEALLACVKELDGAALTAETLVVDPCAGPAAEAAPEFVRAFRLARRRIAAYHRRQRPKGFAFRDAEGVSFRERPVPHAAAGVYVPGGRAFYPSSLLMGAVPAQVAGVKRIVLATPPRAWEGSPELRWAARELGLREVLLAGGAHGIAGLASYMGCTKVVGPGNRWVAAAKQLVSSVVSIDLFAGPSEVLVVASSDAEPELVAADLLAQAEHDPRASCLLFTDSVSLARKVNAEVERQIADLPTAATARESLAALGLTVVFPSLKGAAEAARGIASEHLQLLGKKAEKFREPLSETAGALFSGSATPTAFGDYLAGPNHVLPTGGAGRSFSGLSTRDFYRWGRSVSFSRAAARKLAPSAASLARFEGLIGHARSLERRAK
jgi:histidinol dehydrogenase